jgi:UDP-N-acetylmuramoyl-L-alanyl-D-glutamate--2,6-diaminopimelate ligase
VQDKAIEILGRLHDAGVVVRELATDSRRVGAGDVFLAYPGARRDGREFISGAIANGAAAVLWEQAGCEGSQRWGVPNFAVENLRELAGHLAHEVYGRPSEKLWVIGITGTNGKTSCSQWLAQACGACGARTAVIGTLGIGFPGALDESINTTPDAVLLHRSLQRLHASGAQGVAMEVSSIGLDQGRANGVAFGVALFTNLSRDHLDYHGDMEHYARSKQKLFLMPGLKNAVVNLDDVQGVHIARMLAGRNLNRAGYSCFEEVAARSGLERFVEAHRISVSTQGTAFEIKSSWGEARVTTPLLGRYNVSNLIGVLATMLVSGVPFADAAAALEKLSSVPGRMERIGGGDRPLLAIDYAHSPDALENVASVLKDVALAQGGRLFIVFGCGGERDRGKRPLMGATASRHADRIIVTSDNPRGENPVAIIDEIAAGITVAYEAIADRRQAIGAAVSAARAGDVVLLAGKGHETHQEIGGRRLPFSDAREAHAALSRWAQ